MPPIRPITLAVLGLSCARPAQEAPESVLRRHVSRALGVPESAVATACEYNPVVLHLAQAHHCRAEVNGVVGLYACDCPVATRSVWPVDGPLVSPWRRPRPCECWEVCCVEVEESTCGCFEWEGSTTCFHHACFPCSSARGCVVDAACMTVWPNDRCQQTADPRLPTAPRAGAATP